MTPAGIVEQRLVAQRISTAAFTRPEEVVAWLGAVQAQDYLGALWAVGLRTREPREQDVERAIAERESSVHGRYAGRFTSSQPRTRGG